MLNECPQKYCFCWVAAGGKANLSDTEYDSFEEAVSSDNQVIFLHGGCSRPLGIKCRRETKCPEDADMYEPFNSVLKRNGYPELFFCNPDTLDDEDRVKYDAMAKHFWESDV